jgi:hypothetical protein
MIKYVYDIECLRNLFTATFINADDEQDKHVFYIGLGDDRGKKEFYKFLSQEMVLIGYNNWSYDDPVLRYIMNSSAAEKINDKLFLLSHNLIDRNFSNDPGLMELRFPKKRVYPWKSIDLMKLLGFDKVGVSLKQVAIGLKWNKILDLPLAFDERVTVVQLPEILDYNLNDVLITKKLYDEIKPQREFREKLGNLYNIDFSSASDSKIANLILEHFYTTELKKDVRSIRDMRTRHTKILLGDCIADFASFKTPQLSELLERISATYVYSYNKFSYKEEISFANCKLSLGIGGLHSADVPGIFLTDEEYIIQDMDVTSYYPNLIINNGFYPKHLGTDFIHVFKRILEERLAAKQIGETVRANALKITANSIFGKLGFEYFWLYDPKQMLSTTLSGQIGLLMLVEKLYLAGILIISCNTDGVICKIPRKLENKYYEVVKEWEKITGLELEFSSYKKYVRRDVNSYIAQKEDGKTKEKGVFVTELDLKRAFHMPIVSSALRKYYIENIPIEETIKNCKDIMEFCISQKMGDNFVAELHSPSDIEILQKTNRFYVSKRGGTLLKRDKVSNKLTGLCVGRLVRILNDYNNKILFETYDVDYNYYIKEAMKIVDEIEPKQQPLFDLSLVDSGAIFKMPLSRQYTLFAEDYTPGGLNKLGKLQRMKKIEQLVNQKGVIPNLNVRYTYITNFDASTMVAYLYSLGKGAEKKIQIARDAYKKEPLFAKGKLIYCTKFVKDKGIDFLVDYKVVEKFEEDKPGFL